MCWNRAARAALLLAASLATRSAVAGDLPPSFSEKYQPAVEKLKDVYSHSTVTGTVKREFPLKGESFEQKYTLRSSGIKQRLDISTTQNKKGGLPVGTVEVYLATPDASMYGTGRVNAPAIDVAQELTYSQALSQINKAFPIDKPFSMGSDGTVLNMLQSPQVHAGKPEKIDYKGQKFVKISYGQHVPGSHGESKSYVILSPSEGWAVREFSKSTGQGASEKRIRGKISYGESRDGVPMVEKIETWQYEGAQQTLVAHETIQISKFDANDPNMSYFGADKFH
jgi:hypothetical protein